MIRTLIASIAALGITYGTSLAASPNDTIVVAGSTGSIVDTYSNAWTITPTAKVAVNGVVLSTTAGVAKLVYVNNGVWELNTSGNWYALGMTPAVLSSASKISPIPTWTGGVIDTQLNSWTITPTAQMSVNGTAITATKNVLEISYVGNVIWEHDSSGLWYSVVAINGAATTMSAGTTTAPN